jgi:hypothetical protein
MFIVYARNIAHEYFDPAITFLVALRAKDMAMGCSRPLLELNDQESMAIFALILGFASVCWPVLAPNLRSGDVDCSKMLTAPLLDNLISYIPRHRKVGVTYAFIVFQLRALKNKKSRLPPSKVLPTFR